MGGFLRLAISEGGWGRTFNGEWKIKDNLFLQCVGGNIMTSSPISDLNPIFMAIGATLELASLGKTLMPFWPLEFILYF